jgi:hypothetical protein
VGEIGSRSGDSGAPKLVCSNGEVVAAFTRFESEGSRPVRGFSKVSGGGMVRGVTLVAAVDGILSRGVGETDDDGGDGDDDCDSEGSAGAEFCESCEWLRTGGGSSVGIGGGIVATV